MQGDQRAALRVEAGELTRTSTGLAVLCAISVGLSAGALNSGRTGFMPTWFVIALLGFTCFIAGVSVMTAVMIEMLRRTLLAEDAAEETTGERTNDPEGPGEPGRDSISDRFEAWAVARPALFKLLLQVLPRLMAGVGALTLAAWAVLAN